jgi:hypothetical protein
MSKQFRIVAAASSPARCGKCGGLSPVGPPPDLAAALSPDPSPDALIAGLTAGRSDIGPAAAPKVAAPAPAPPDLAAAIRASREVKE